MKLMYALWGTAPWGTAPWGTAPETDLHAAELREAFRAVGATRLQVNVDDADVAPAKLRITSFDAPVGAVLSIWTHGEASPISELVARLAERSAGWEVEERVPLEPPHAEDGVRNPALAQIAFLRIPADLDAAEWLHRWQGQHTSVAIETQATFGYVQNRVMRTVLGSDRVDAIVEELFPMAAMTDVHAWYGSAGDDAELRRRLGLMIESITRFGAHQNLDSVPTSRYVYDMTPS